jgi:hypothetical protein
MSAEDTTSGTTYRGLRSEDGNCTITIEDDHGHRIGAVRHLPKRSPTGMNWAMSEPDQPILPGACSSRPSGRCDLPVVRRYKPSGLCER